MIGIVIVANGNLAEELCDCLEGILGRQEFIKPIGIEGDHNRNEKEEEICHAICQVEQGDGVILLTDVYGSSPSNLSICACKRQRGIILTGVNLPMLIKLAKCRNKSLEEAATLALNAGRCHINLYSEL